MSDVETPIVDTIEDPQAPTNQQQGTIDLNRDLNTGYVVGLTKDGGFIFQVLGSEPGLAELLGLQQHAAERVKMLYGAKQATADSLAVKMLQELGQMVAALDQKVQRLQAKLDPKPENKL
jgi:uncharacterized small protein (DUF1192 family)